MKPIESPLVFWKNIDKVFPTGHQVPRSLLETCCKMDWFQLIFRLLEAYFASYKAIATYFICLAVCLWIFAVCFAVEIQNQIQILKDARSV